MGLSTSRNFESGCQTNVTMTSGGCVIETLSMRLSQECGAPVVLGGMHKPQHTPMPGARSVDRRARGAPAGGVPATPARPMHHRRASQQRLAPEPHRSSVDPAHCASWADLPACCPRGTTSRHVQPCQSVLVCRPRPPAHGEGRGVTEPIPPLQAGRSSPDRVARAPWEVSRQRYTCSSASSVTVAPGCLGRSSPCFQRLHAPGVEWEYRCG